MSEFQLLSTEETETLIKLAQSGDENAKENRPESVKVNLYADGVLVDTIELNKENNKENRNAIF